MDAELSGVLVKINRARAHLNDFDRQASRVGAACRKAVVRELDQQTSEHVSRFSHVPAVDPRTSAIIGGAIHALRLDIIDRHRGLLVAVVGIHSISWFGDVKLIGFNAGPYSDGTEMWRCIFSEGALQDDFNPAVSFGPPK